MVIIISDRLRRPAEVERDELRKQLAEAKAEIERLKSEHEDSLRRAKDNAVSLSGAVTEYAGKLLVKDRLIEQMKAEIERLKRCCNCEYANHKLEICEHPDNEPETFMDGVCDLWSHNI